MESAFHSTQRVGEIVAAFPGASNLFKAHGIDFCCGGGKSLADALRERQIPPQSFLAQLHLAYEETQARQAAVGTDWRAASLRTLIERIVKTHHAYLKQELPLLSAFVNKIHHVHAERHPELAVLDQLFHDLKAELDPHMVSEETELFPLVQTYELSGDQADLARALAVLEELESEHQAAGQLLAAMRQVTDGYRLPEDACRTYTLSFQKLADLESDMFEHIHLENNILFPRLREGAR